MPAERGRRAQPPGPLANEPLSTITPQVAIEMYEEYLRTYRASISCPREQDIFWPSETKFRKLPDAYARGMNVDLALGIAGPVCQVLTLPEPAPDGSVVVNAGASLILYARKKDGNNDTAETTAALDEKWRKAHDENRTLTVNGHPIPSCIALPRKLPLSPKPLKRVTKAAPHFSFKFFGAFPTPDPPNKCSRKWSFARVVVGRNSPLEEIANAVNSTRPPNHNARYSLHALLNPDTVYLLLELGAFYGRDRSDHATILFRVRIAKHNASWIPWTPTLDPNELVPIETRAKLSTDVSKSPEFYDLNGNFVERDQSPDRQIKRESRSPSPFIKRDPDIKQEHAYTLGPRKQGIYRQQYALGGRRHF
ncbi:uncharacterized protein JCM6883_007654 [Sporobolomyces salmoneus]|uniref:uncharacterized protein n=1 Tax=Sporobolomyces salmoneus TaxID=183962 RepID=UPI00317053AC